MKLYQLAQSYIENKVTSIVISFFDNQIDYFFDTINGSKVTIVIKR